MFRSWILSILRVSLDNPTLFWCHTSVRRSTYSDILSRRRESVKRFLPLNLQKSAKSCKSLTVLPKNLHVGSMDLTWLLQNQGQNKACRTRKVDSGGARLTARQQPSVVHPFCLDERKELQKAMSKDRTRFAWWFRC